MAQGKKGEIILIMIKKGDTSSKRTGHRTLVVKAFGDVTNSPLLAPTLKLIYMLLEVSMEVPTVFLLDENCGVVSIDRVPNLCVEILWQKCGQSYDKNQTKKQSVLPLWQKCGQSEVLIDDPVISR